MMADDVLAELKRLIKKYVRKQDALESAGPATRIREDLGVSSANLVDIVMEIEEAFDLTIEDQELANITTIGDALKLIEAKRAAAA